MAPRSEEKISRLEGAGILCFVRISYLEASSTATATETVIPTMGLLPAPRKPIISTSKPPKGGFCVAAQRVLHILFQCGNCSFSLVFWCVILSANNRRGDSMAEKKAHKIVSGYKCENQEYKSLLVMQYILKNTDDEHAVTIG